MISLVDNKGPDQPAHPCMDGQADLGLCCPHMLKDMFLHAAAHIIIKRRNLHKQLWHYLV